jgi:WD40 repeat protein/Flp pilus assembly protein TadD
VCGHSAETIPPEPARIEAPAETAFPPDGPADGDALADPKAPRPAADAPDPTPPSPVSDDPTNLGSVGPAGARTLAPIPPRPQNIAGFEVLAELGRGGMGVVYQARQTKLNRLVALKMILSGACAGEQELARFHGEAKAAARLQHPNIVQVHEVGEHNGLPFFALELVGGGSLAARLAGRPLPAREAARLAEALARAVHYAHEQGVVHRDLKPANVLLTADGSPKVTDFGLAKMVQPGPDGPAPGGPTQSGAILGTPSYMAPEQAQGRAHRVGPAADIYALGAILYEMLTGRPPFVAATPLDTLLQVVGDEPVPPRRLQGQVPLDLETVCLKCLQKEPAKRYASAAALADDLSRFLAGRPIQARPVGAAERAWRWCRRNPAVASLLAAVALLLAAGTAVAWVLAIRAGRAADEALEFAGKAHANELRANANAEGEKARTQEAERNLLAARGNLYLADIHRAQQAWELNQVERMRLFLRAQEPDQTGGIDLRGFEWHYLNGLLHTDLLSFEKPPGPAAGVAFSPDGSRLASASGFLGLREAEQVQVWEVATGRLALTHQGLTAAPAGAVIDPDRVGVAFSPDGKYVASGGADGAVRVWDAAGVKPVRTLAGHQKQVYGVAFSPDGRRLASGGEDGTVRVWDVTSGKELISLRGHTHLVYGVAFSPDGRRLASGGGDNQGPGEAKVWDVREGREVFDLRGHTGQVNGVAFSPDGRRLASASLDGTIRVWDALTGQAVGTLQGHTSGVLCVAFRPDGRRLATGSFDYTVRLWDADTGKTVLTLKGHTRPVRSMAFNPVGTLLASASSDGSSSGEVKVWDATAADQDTVVLRGNEEGCGKVVFSPAGDRLAVAPVFFDKARNGWMSQAVRVWDTRGGQELFTLDGAIGQVDGLLFSPDGRHLAAPGADRTVKVWDARSGRPTFSLAGHQGVITRLAFSPDSTRLASASGDRTIKVWDVVRGQEVLTLREQAEEALALAFGEGGRSLAVVGKDCKLRLWELPGGRQTLSLAIPGDMIGHFDCRFSPDGRRLAGSYGGQRWVKVWDVPTGRELLTTTYLPSEVTDLAISPDGDLLAFAGNREEVKVLDVKAGKELFTLRGHAGRGLDRIGLTFSGDGRRLASVCFDGVKLWDTRTGQETLSLKYPGRIDPSLVFSGDGKRLACWSWKSRGVTLWNAEPAGEELRTARRRELERGLSVWHRREATDAEQAGNWFAALFHLDRLRQTGPPDAALYASRGLTLARLGRGDEALADLGKSLEQDPKQAWVWRLRGHVHAQRGQWERAAADADRSLELNPKDDLNWSLHGMLLLQAGDRDGYRRCCAEMLKRFGQTGDPWTANDVAWNCVVVPDAVPDFRDPLRLAEQAVAADPQRSERLNTLGAVLYRAGRYEDAVRRHQEAIKLRGPGDAFTDWVFLAMASHRLGRAEEAKRWLSQAAAGLERGARADPPLSWSVLLQWQWLYREAAELITGKPPEAKP